MQCKNSEAAETPVATPPSFLVVRVTVRAGGSVRVRGRRVSLYPGGSALAALEAPQCRGSRFSTARSYLESASNYYSVIHLYSHGFLIPGEMCID